MENWELHRAVEESSESWVGIGHRPIVESRRGRGIERESLKGKWERREGGVAGFSSREGTKWGFSDSMEEKTRKGEIAKTPEEWSGDSLSLRSSLLNVREHLAQAQLFWVGLRFLSFGLGGFVHVSRRN